MLQEESEGITAATTRLRHHQNDLDMLQRRGSKHIGCVQVLGMKSTPLRSNLSLRQVSCLAMGVAASLSQGTHRGDAPKEGSGLEGVGTRQGKDSHLLQRIRNIELAS